MTKEFDAELRVVAMFSYGLPDMRAEGLIFNDKKGRFNDGDSILTSTIDHVSTDDEGVMYIRTRNTTYKINQQLKVSL